VGSSLASLLVRKSLRRLAGDATFERGAAYASGGRVGEILVDGERLLAAVAGTRRYRVQLWADRDGLGHSCTCPVGEDGLLCKHCVAVGLAWQPGSALTRRRPAGTPAVTLADVRAHLDRQPREALVELLIEHALTDDALRRRLLLEAAGGRGDTTVATYRAAIARAVDSGRRGESVQEVIGSVEALIAGGQAVAAAGLLEQAAEAVEEAIRSEPGSREELGDALERIAEAHLAACRRARPDPVELAGRLFRLASRSHLDTWDGAAGRYADLLGPGGVAAHRALAQAVWERVPALGPGDVDADDDGSRAGITRMMERLAAREGDVDALVAVLGRDLSVPHSFLRIAGAYREAGRHDQALEWAERGVAAFRTEPDQRLTEFLAGEYGRRGRHEEALDLAWSEFDALPSLEAYQRLSSYAGSGGGWPAWRTRALDRMRAGEDDRARRAAGWPPSRGRSEVVRTLLWEGDVEAAWREARDHDCLPDLWMELATRRERDHPEDVLTIYQRLVERTLARKTNEAYREAVGLLGRIRDLMARLDRRDDFAAYLASVRAAHRAKRNLMRLLDAASLADRSWIQ